MAHQAAYTAPPAGQWHDFGCVPSTLEQEHNQSSVARHQIDSLAAEAAEEHPSLVSNCSIKAEKLQNVALIETRNLKNNNICII